VWNTIHITNIYFIKDGALEIRKETVSEGFFCHPPTQADKQENEN
jgi:hypothetical protein